ncbi:MAG TPA: hypothetical protein VN278_04800, partial [Methanosarcina sp.]|nr:hypothetical protein [Methanosarcina sp.]
QIQILANMLQLVYKISSSFLLIKRITNIPQVFSVGIEVKELLKPYKNYGETTLKNTFFRYRILADSSIIDQSIMKTFGLYSSTGR